MDFDNIIRPGEVKQLAFHQANQISAVHPPDPNMSSGDVSNKAKVPLGKTTINITSPCRSSNEEFGLRDESLRAKGQSEATNGGNAVGGLVGHER